MLCSAVKHLGNVRALDDCVSCFPLHFFRALRIPFPACFTTEQSTVVEASLFVSNISQFQFYHSLDNDRSTVIMSSFTIDFFR